jgi:hypothetical protein
MPFKRDVADASLKEDTYLKRSTKLALSLVLAAGAIMPAFAQDNFPDAPANHWAYEALGKMKQEGLLVGYPDGLFRGNRPASRYELAVAMHAVYTHLRNLIDGLSQQVDALKSINPQDIQNLKDQVAHLQDEINAMKGWGDDIAALKRATSEFDRELKALGVDVDAMKKDLGDLQERVTRLEKRRPAVDISGDVNFFAATTNSEGHKFGLTQDGRPEGYSGAVPTGLFHDLAFLHEGAFTFTGTNEAGPKWKGTIVFGNMFGPGGFGNQSSLNPIWGIAPAPGATQLFTFAEGKDDVYIQDLSAKWDLNLVGFAFNAEVGRVAYSNDNMVLKRASNESYFRNERWDDGKYRMDGAILGFNFGPAKLHVFGGNTGGVQSVNGIEINPWIVRNTRTSLGGEEALANGINVDFSGQVDKAFGADATFGLGSNGHVGLQFLTMENTGAIGGHNVLINDEADRVNVFGGSAEFGFGRFKLSGGYHVSDLTNAGHASNSHDNDAWNVMGSYSADRFNVWAGYREVKDRYYAPGDWGRLGIIVNPGNIKGWQAGAYVDLSSALRLSANGEWDKGASDEAGGVYASPFNSHTNIQQYGARLDFRVNPNFSLYGGWDDAKFTGLAAMAAGGGAAREQMDWTTFGMNYGLSANAKFNLQYQFSNAGGDLGVPVGTTTLGRFTGGILTSQLTIKF